MEYMPLGIALLALLVSLFFRTPKEASAEAREDAKQMRQDILRLWEAHNGLAMQYAVSSGRIAEQHNGHEKELNRLNNEIASLAKEIRGLSDSIRQGDRHDREKPK